MPAASVNKLRQAQSKQWVVNNWMMTVVATPAMAWLVAGCPLAAISDCSWRRILQALAKLRPHNAHQGSIRNKSTYYGFKRLLCAS